MSTYSLAELEHFAKQGRTGTIKQTLTAGALVRGRIRGVLNSIADDFGVKVYEDKGFIESHFYIKGELAPMVEALQTLKSIFPGSVR